MKRWKKSSPPPDLSRIDEALDALDAEQLRDLLRELLPSLDRKTCSRFAAEIIARAATGGSGWRPAGPTNREITEALAFVHAAMRVGYADPSDIDHFLRQGNNAFLRRDYGSAARIFQEFLLPISDGSIDLGYHETLEEALGTDPADCAAQYVVSVYMTSPPDRRAAAVLAAVGEMREIGFLGQPLREMERVAVEPFPQFDLFLPRWRKLIEESGAQAGERRDEGRAEWLREAVQRLEGSQGLGKIARSTRQAEDLQAWCSALTGEGDWKTLLAAFEEAAGLVDHNPGEFLDGAALAARELGRKDFPHRLGSAWRAAPTMLRLRRWLGTSPTASVLKKRAVEALADCPPKARRQRGLLHLLLADFESAAHLLASAPGLGWSDSEHPGHLLFPVFCHLCGGDNRLPDHGDTGTAACDLDLGAGETLDPERREPRLPDPPVDTIIELACLRKITNPRDRALVIKAMREAARKRIEGVTSQARRSHYDHAAFLAAACVAVDDPSAASCWISSIRARYSRYSALRRELDHSLNRVGNVTPGT